jgi:hypothetical protein
LINSRCYCIFHHLMLFSADSEHVSDSKVKRPYSAVSDRSRM